MKKIMLLFLSSIPTFTALSAYKPFTCQVSSTNTECTLPTISDSERYEVKQRKYQMYLGENPSIKKWLLQLPNKTFEFDIDIVNGKKRTPAYHVKVNGSPIPHEKLTLSAGNMYYKMFPLVGPKNAQGIPQMYSYKLDLKGYKTTKKNSPTLTTQNVKVPMSGGFTTQVQNQLIIPKNAPKGIFQAHQLNWKNDIVKIFEITVE